MRRKKHAATENHERWLVSYADFITLLFAFFVVLFAATQSDKAHAKAFSDAIKKALDHGPVQTRIAEMWRGAAEKPDPNRAVVQGSGGARTKLVQTVPNTPEAAPLSSSIKVLTDDLHEEIAAGNIHLKLEARGLVIGLETTTFFPSGGDTVAPSAYPTIAKLAAVLNKVPNALRLEGHTDSIPINTARFQSNWELSAARSIAMLRLLSEKYGVDSQRMAVVGYADNAAVDSNDTEEGRERNRRVDIVIVSDLGMRAEPPQAVGNTSGKEAPAPQERQQTKDENKD